jgi:N-acetylglutamate synthase-like GNAT family acetyltransferase
MTNEKQIGFARFITDYATFAMMRDVFILPEYRQQGYAQMLIQHMLNEIKEHDIRRVMLGTIDSHGLYKKLGITP